MIHCESGVFQLNTPSTTYLIRITKTGHPEHLYYGPRMNHVGDLASYQITGGLRMPTIVSYSEDQSRTYLTMLSLEASSYGKGDLREVMFAGRLGESGNVVFDFRYEYNRIEKDIDDAAPWLPSARKTGSETLILGLKDFETGIGLELYYTVYPDSDVIVRRSRIINGSSESLTIEALSSLQLDLIDSGFEALTFDGAWMRERTVHRTKLNAGVLSVSSSAGASSAEHNPLFIMESGQECYLFNLLWSGDHRESAEVSPYGTVRVLAGLNPASFAWKLAPGEDFYSPEAIQVYSDRGESGVMHESHHFVREYISPSNWKGKTRPILLNSWEGMGLDLTEEKLMRQAAAAKELGIELFVIDDGWFRRGLSADSDLGDWEPDKKKLPHGLKPVSQYIHSLGMLAGIWIEPEMISKKSRLYEEHPDYLVRCKNREPSPGRDQYLLDLSREEVVESIFEKLEKLIGENDFDYVKWDMNRYLSDDYSDGIWIPEFRFRWVIGFYSLLRRLAMRFPQLLIEGCASGGGRYDLGVLRYVNQFWGSDNTDASCRVSIFHGTMYGYPQDTFGAHVSRSPNGLTGRVLDYETAFHINAFGAFGYELDVTKLSESERQIFGDQISFYKTYREIFQFGKFTEVRYGDTVIRTCENEDASVIIALYLEKEMTFAGEKVRLLTVPSCREDRLYRVTARRQWITNPLMCERRGGIHLSETFERIVPGALLQTRGMILMPVYQGTDYPENAAYPGDYGSRLFLIEEIRR